MVTGISFAIPISGNDTIFSPQEQKLLTLFQEALCFEDGAKSQIAYNGVLADCNRPLEEDPPWHSDAYTITLLQDEFVPDVNLARNTIDQLPFEASCCLAMMCKGASLTDQFDLLDQDSLVFVTERDLQAVIERHPNWMRQLMDSDDRTQIELPRTLHERLCLVAQKCGKAVQFDFCDTSYADRSLTVASTPDGDLTLDFPVGMFALPEKENSPLAYFRWHSNLYNSDHTFSQWLIQNRPQLTKMVPAIYNTLIRTMVLGEDGATIRNTVNTILTRLRSFNGNYFGIHDDLFLTEADFV